MLRDLSRQAAAGTRISLRVSRPEFHSNNAMPCPVADATQAGSKAVQMHVTGLNQVGAGADYASGGAGGGAGGAGAWSYQLSLEHPSSKARQQPPYNELLTACCCTCLMPHCRCSPSTRRSSKCMWARACCCGTC